MPVLAPPPSAGALFADVPTPDPRTLDDAVRLRTVGELLAPRPAGEGAK